MSLFFVEHLSDAPKKKKGAVSLTTLHQLECKGCPLNKVKVYNPKIEPSGSDNPDIYILGESPGDDEDEKGEHWSGEGGDLLKKILRKKWLNKCRFNNCVRTHPDEENPIGFLPIECCRPSIIKDIEETKPKAVFGFGNVPLNWVLGEGAISRWRGRRLPVKIGKHVCWFFPFLDPTALLGMRRNYEGSDTTYLSDKEYIFKSDVKHALGEVSVLPTPHVPNKEEVFAGVECVWGANGDKDVRKILRYLKRFAEFPEVGIDYETSSDESIRDVYRLVRPYGKGAKILSIAISAYDETIAFGVDHPECKWTRKQIDKIFKAFKHFMLKTKTVKVAHNLAFEMEWAIVRWGLDFLRKPRWGDTMAQAYLLDQRQGMLKLDILTWIHFGFRLKTFSSIDVANLDMEPIEDVLEYNGGDAKWEIKLYHRQKEILLNRGLIKVYNEQIRRVSTTVMMQYLGIPIHQKTIKVFQKDLGDEIEDIDLGIKDIPEIIEFTKKYGSFNPASTKDCTRLFRDELELEAGRRKTATGYSTADDVLTDVDLEIAQLILKRRELVKVKSTYIDSLAKDGKFLWPDGLAHPSINTAQVSTRRTSYDSQNFQNYPKKRNRNTRSTVRAPKDHTILSVDFGQIEARVIGMASKDKNFCKALWEGYDVHMEWAERICHQYPRIIGGKKYLNDKETMKDMRQKTKNLFVFPSFFGAQPPSISEDLKIPIEEVTILLKDFWRTFSGVKAWQKKVKEDYRLYGYVELLTGFRRYGPLDGSQIINTPIQGTASDIVIDSMNRLSEYACKEDIKYHPRLIIHDDLSFFLPKKRLDEMAGFIIDEMLKINFKFINVPLTVEASMGPNWFDLQEIGTFASND